ncbi:ribosomal protein S12 methylthiotransferase accessory factor [Azospirillum fermentarium]|uniref:YcaO-like family protein n=1 Tax=Azospirillum fermentarium TaxID=1233114 RepID=UPI0022275F2A|nr:YcaO-like family protein [Azospirillum fermentarium]MCW2248898.1 ribosomal protein S12 methylthiotransferase accessory factor [Azospirillum fermentarium]
MPFDHLSAPDVRAPKIHVSGTHRTTSPDATLARVAPLFPVMGITRVANVTGLDKVGIPVVMVTRPNARSVAVSQGKGATLEAAKASGVMESVESYHAERITLPVKFASYEDLRWSHRVVDVTRLPRLAGSRFSPHTPMLWIEGTDLMSGEPALVPYEMVSMNYTLPLPPGSGAFIASSNGLASGNHRLEAITHALNEVVERDALTLWHQRGPEARSARRLDLSTVTDPLCRGLLLRFEAAGVEVAAWDLTTDTGLPTFLVRVVEGDAGLANTIRPATGSGTHTAREVALSRALTEAAQSRLTFISGARDDMARDEYAAHLSPDLRERWRREAAAPGTLDFAHVPSAPADTLDADLNHQIARLQAVGIAEAVAVDLTKPEFGIPVVRVIVPGLEGVDHSPDYLLGARARAVVTDAAVLPNPSGAY